jgi:hypothetical protein
MLGDSGHTDTNQNRAGGFGVRKLRDEHRNAVMLGRPHAAPGHSHNAIPPAGRPAMVMVMLMLMVMVMVMVSLDSEVLL